ncbi:TMV resistance protein [Salix suchowensis]|nr:TMV resistance protein [Salix suchowensis]
MDFSSYTYQVFLSFRGEDTRKNFTDHLYSTLTRAGIVTFRDDNSIQRGENIESEIERAIKESQMSVVVLSKDYASSSWCLDELVMIMDRKKLDSTALLAPFIAWHRYRLLMKKTKMILHVLYLTVAFIFVGLFLYKWIGMWMYLQSGVDEHMASHPMSFRGAGADSHRTWTNLIIDGKEIKSAGTKKNIDVGIKVTCWLVLAFFLS